MADSLQGAAVLDTLGGKADPTAIRALAEGTLPIFNSSIAFVAAGVFLASAGCAILATGALSKWIGWLACTSAFLRVVAILGLVTAWSLAAHLDAIALARQFAG